MDLKLEINRVFPSDSPPRFNVAAWEKAERDHVILVGREVNEPGSPGLPDKGKLVLFEIDRKNRITHERVLWEPIGNNLYLEDPRALVNRNGSVTVGMTAVIKTEDGFSPYPAYVNIRSGSTWSGMLPPLCFIHAFGPGKNLTPVKKNKFLVRPEREDYNHRLLFFDITDDDPRSSYDINFPENLEWGLWRIGTAMPPLWVGKTSALFIIHGITIQDGKYIYTIGRAKLFKKKGKYQAEVFPKPFISPDTFRSADGFPERELHPELRKVVYACGGVIRKKEPEYLYLYVNVGDTATYEVKILLSDLQKGLF